jgi:transposase-like protein
VVGVAERRCTVHALRNITAKLPERLHREVKARYWAVLDDAVAASDAKAGLLALAGDYRAAYPSAMATIDEHVDQLVAHIERLRRGQQPLPTVTDATITEEVVAA